MNNFQSIHTPFTHCTVGYKIKTGRLLMAFAGIISGKLTYEYKKNVNRADFFILSKTASNWQSSATIKALIFSRYFRLREIIAIAGLPFFFVKHFCVSVL